ERDRLVVLERVVEPDPGAVTPRTVCEPERAGDSASFVPPVARHDLGGQGLAHALEHAVDDVEIVQETAEEAVREGLHDLRVSRYDCRLDLDRIRLRLRGDYVLMHDGAANYVVRIRERYGCSGFERYGY